MLENESYCGLEIRYIQDQDAESPRNWDNLGTIAAFHRQYRLSDTDCKLTQEEVKGEIAKPGTISLPIYMYDHSGITIRTYPFSCPWDSGQVGWIFTSREKILKEFSCSQITKKIGEKVENILRSEVKVYDAYLKGEVYGWEVLDPEGEVLDSCWGYILASEEDETYIENEARNSAKYHAEQRLQDAVQDMQQMAYEEIPA